MAEIALNVQFSKKNEKWPLSYKQKPYARYLNDFNNRYDQKVIGIKSICVLFI